MSAAVEPLPLPERAVCSIDGCGRPIHGRGWCDSHYKRWYTHGDPLGGHPRPRHPNPWSGQYPCPTCGSDEWTLPYAFGGDLWRCVACRLFFEVAADERPAA